MRKRACLSVALLASLLLLPTGTAVHAHAAVAPPEPAALSPHVPRPASSARAARSAPVPRTAPAAPVRTPGEPSRSALPHGAPLHWGPDGVLYYDYTVPRTVAPPAGNAARRWQPAAPLPTPDGRPTLVVYAPHPDDETLSMGALITASVRAGNRVVVVCLTDGRRTAATRTINRSLAAAGGSRRAGRWLTGPLTSTDIATVRVRELYRAAASLGVPARDVYLAHLDARGSDGGEGITVAEASQVMTAFAARFPDALQVTMSAVAERNPDHLAAGYALRALNRTAVVRRAAWAISRLYWEMPGPAWQWVTPPAGSTHALQRAYRAYATWDPRDREYAVGLISVRWQLRAFALDPRTRLQSVPE